MTCFVCNEKIVFQTNWTSVIHPPLQTRLCQPCENELKLLKGNRCEKCSRMSESTICMDCERWGNMYRTEGDPLIRNFSLYTYNAFMKSIVVNWKYRGDYILGYIFKEVFREHFHLYFQEIAESAAIVPIPLSDTRKKERGFNQATMLASFLRENITDNLVRIHSEKQSKKNRRERIVSTNPFKLKSPINKRVILVDDIYTTGRTLRHAAKTLKKNGCTEVYAYTLIRG